ncbi:hypothetical protein F4777DRAFT_492479 [Nemania sp. FL0916]|nr:hypothetical protein F4777DRAFT_492479 [Nemania sp. FL0916]
MRRECLLCARSCSHTTAALFPPPSLLHTKPDLTLVLLFWPAQPNSRVLLDVQHPPIHGSQFSGLCGLGLLVSHQQSRMCAQNCSLIIDPMLRASLSISLSSFCALRQPPVGGGGVSQSVHTARTYPARVTLPAPNGWLADRVVLCALPHKVTTTANAISQLGTHIPAIRSSLPSPYRSL